MSYWAKHFEPEFPRVTEDEITCPYCKHKLSESWECGDSDDKRECEECGKFFFYSREVTVEYRCYADCALNGDEHSFEPYYKHLWKCTRCEKVASRHEKEAA
jgi:hypothetical protein